MNDLLDVLKTCRAMQKIAKTFTQQEVSTDSYKEFLHGYSAALDFVMSLMSQKINEAEEKENA